MVLTPHPRLRSFGWLAHYVLRLVLALFLFAYGFSKVFLIQMGVPDLSDALVRSGEMSPMGLLWRQVGYSPTYQVCCGLAEVVAGVLLLVRRTAGLGAAIAVADMAMVLLLNLTFDVPVKQLAAFLLGASVLALVPYAGRFAAAFLTSGEVQGGPLPTIWGRGRVAAVMPWVGVVACVALATAVAWPMLTASQRAFAAPDSPVAGGRCVPCGRGLRPTGRPVGRRHPLATGRGEWIGAPCNERASGRRADQRPPGEQHLGAGTRPCPRRPRDDLTGRVRQAAGPDDRGDAAT